ncbi:organic hydroperoxide resistance protein [Embleya scabrispora]|uniref:organic hydroperoxide resistance protein n=1 Tax=Embleya scabrispora TaxID=159449 RepID=UPI000379EC3D|nr:organic hydroperoxide resistance protein [Embleya scabrispora]MYS83490.1 Ohr family peroxiredoxin [Streptomyces sp. SID5474]
MSLYTAIATSAGRDGRAVSSDGQLDVTLGLQKELGGDGIGTNPEQLFAAGYAACFASAMQLVAKRQKVDAADASVTAEVGLDANGDGGFGLSVTLRVELPEHLSTEQGRALIEATHQVCPYSNATRGNIPVELVVE